MALTQMLVLTMQQGLAEYARTRPQVPSVGVIDGRYGARTKAAYLAYLQDEAVVADEPEFDAANGTPSGSRWINVTPATLEDLASFAVAYQALPSGLEPPRTIDSPVQVPTNVAQTPLTIGPHLDEPLASPGGSDQGLDTAAKVGLAVLAVGAIGGVIYLVTRKKR